MLTGLFVLCPPPGPGFSDGFLMMVLGFTVAAGDVSFTMPGPAGLTVVTDDDGAGLGRIDEGVADGRIDEGAGDGRVDEGVGLGRIDEGAGL